MAFTAATFFFNFLRNDLTTQFCCLFHPLLLFTGCRWLWLSQPLFTVSLAVTESLQSFTCFPKCIQWILDLSNYSATWDFWPHPTTDKTLEHTLSYLPLIYLLNFIPCESGIWKTTFTVWVQFTSLFFTENTFHIIFLWRAIFVGCRSLDQQPFGGVTQRLGCFFLFSFLFEIGLNVFKIQECPNHKHWRMMALIINVLTKLCHLLYNNLQWIFELSHALKILNWIYRWMWIKY